MPFTPRVLFPWLLAFSASPSLAQLACPATPAALPAELSGWNSPSEAIAATTAETASAVELIIGHAMDVELARTAEVVYAISPAKPGAAASHGGLVSLHVATAGIYRIAIDTGAWLDVVSEGKSLKSTGHGHGPACSGVRKMVDFRLEPGIYAVQIAGNPANKVRMLVARVPAG